MAEAPNSTPIREGQSSDLAAIVDIYNHYVTETPITFDTEPFAIGARTHWFSQFGGSGPYRLFVTELEGRVIGYACSTPFKSRPAYGTSVETTIYMHPEHTGERLGRPLYETLLDALRSEPGVHRAYGGVTLPNPQSVGLHESLGFQRVATYHEVGFKFDRYWDVAWFEKAV